ncbi:MAG TPA: helix-turn-helix transcriptional regulator [Rhizomicrobium sp.]
MDDILHTARISTDAIASRDRVEVTREIFGRQILRLEVEEMGDAPFRANLKLQAMPGLRIVSGAFSASRVSRTRALLSDGNDDIFLTGNHFGPFTVTQRGKETMLGDGESIISTCTDVIKFERLTGAAIGLRIPRAILAPHIPNLDEKINRLIPHSDEVMSLLRGYVRVFENSETVTPEFARLAVTHIHDLLALSLGARPDFTEVARERGFGAARLRAIKATIIRDLTRHDLSVTTVAAQHRLTARHVQRLFENEGTTFSRFVLERRLARIHAELTDPGQAHKNIGAIIFDGGFGDVSYFNRAFRRCYGATPTEIRHNSLMHAREML